MGSVSVATKACLLKFSDLIEALNRELDEHLDMTLEDVETQYDRLRIWAGNLGALQSGKSSLDFRLLESTVMLNNVVKLLAKLEDILKRSAQIIAGTVIPFEKLSTPDYTSDESDTDDDDDDASEDLPATELRLHMMTIVDIVGDLYKLSFRIRNSSTRPKSLKPNIYKEIDKETGVDIFDAYVKADLNHITESVIQLRKDVVLKESGNRPSNLSIKAVSTVDTIANNEGYLIQRISTAVTLRRKHLRYWQRHTKKLAEIPKDEKEAAAILQAQKVTFDSQADAKDTTEASNLAQLMAPSLAGKTILSQTEATRYDRRLDDMLETQSAVSYVSTAFGPQGDTVDLPPPPALDSKRQEFLCPYCGIICHARQRAPTAWRKHVLQDLQPYVCTYAACDDGAQLYGSRTTWLEHERLVHRRIWQCFEHAEPQFKSQDGLREHLETQHRGDITETQIDNLLAVSESSMADTRTQCPLCLLRGPFPKGLDNHIAFHLETFATFSIKGIVSAGDEDKSASEGQSRSAQVSDPDRSAFSGSLHFGSPPRSDAADDDGEKTVSDESLWEKDIGDLPPATKIRPSIKVDTDAAKASQRPREAHSLSYSALEDESRSPTANYDSPFNKETETETEDAFANTPLFSQDHRVVVVFNLPFEIEEDQMGRFMSRAGTVLAMEAQEDPERADLRRMLVKYESPHEATDAVRILNNRYLGGRRVRVSLAPNLTFAPTDASYPQVDEVSDSDRLSVNRGKKPRPNSPAGSDAQGGQKPFKWIKGQLIGKGTHGRVYLGMIVETGLLIAIKQIELTKSEKIADKEKVKEMIQTIDAEIETLQHLDHQNIVEYLGCERKELSITIFLEYVPGGSIGSCLRKYGKFPERLVSYITRQTLSGLEYLHREGILCRDIKADNLLLDLDGTVKISGFGTSVKTEDAYADDPTYGMQGSVYWMAPEVIRSHGRGYSAKVDIWSLGCTVLEMLSGRRPWSEEEAVGAIYKLGSLSQAPPIPNEVSEVGPAALSFMWDCFTIEPSDRPTAVRLLDHPFVFFDPNFRFEDSELARNFRDSTGGDQAAQPDFQPQWKTMRDTDKIQ